VSSRCSSRRSAASSGASSASCARSTRVEPLQQAHPGRRQPDHVATAVLLVALARDQAVALQLADHRNHVAAVDRQAPAQRRRAGAVACVAVVPAAGVLFALAAGAERAGEPALAPATR
jgi:hypothetical protein